MMKYVSNTDADALRGDRDGEETAAVASEKPNPPSVKGTAEGSSWACGEGGAIHEVASGVGACKQGVRDGGHVVAD